MAERHHGHREASPKVPLHRVLLVKRFDPHLVWCRAAIEVDPGTVDFKPAGVGRERPSERELAVPLIVRATAAAGTDGESVATVIHDRGCRAPPGKGARAGAEHAAVAAAR